MPAMAFFRPARIAIWSEGSQQFEINPLAELHDLRFVLHLKSTEGLSPTDIALFHEGCQ